MDDSSRHWFVPRRFGYGATPANWKGWAVSLAFMLFVAGMVWTIYAGAISEWLGLAIFVIATVALVAFAHANTSGAWRWNWR